MVTNFEKFLINLVPYLILGTVAEFQGSSKALGVLDKNLWRRGLKDLNRIKNPILGILKNLSEDVRNAVTIREESAACVRN